jgi:hypothetical protein
MNKRRTKEQVQREAAIASLDYGPDAGAGLEHLTQTAIQAGVKRGREDAFRSFLASQTDPATREFVAQAGAHGMRTPAFRAALGRWVRERLDSGLPIPGELVDHQIST